MAAVECAPLPAQGDATGPTTPPRRRLTMERSTPSSHPAAMPACEASALQSSTTKKITVAEEFPSIPVKPTIHANDAAWEGFPVGSSLTPSSMPDSQTSQIPLLDQRQVQLEDAGGVATSPKPAATPATPPTNAQKHSEKPGGQQRPRRWRPLAPVSNSTPTRRIALKTPKEFIKEEAKIGNVRRSGYLGAIVADRVLQSTSNMKRARQLLAWFHARAEAGEAKVFGRSVSVEDIEVAEMRVKDVWVARRDRSTKPSLRNAELLVQRLVRCCESFEEAETSLEKLRPEIGKVSRHGRVLSEADLDAVKRCCRRFFDRTSSEGKDDTPFSSPSVAATSATPDCNKKAPWEMRDDGENSDWSREWSDNDRGPSMPPNTAGRKRSRSKSSNGSKRSGNCSSRSSSTSSDKISHSGTDSSSGADVDTISPGGEENTIADGLPRSIRHTHQRRRKGNRKQRARDATKDARNGTQSDLSSEEDVDVEAEGEPLAEEDLVDAPKVPVIAPAFSQAWNGAPTPGTQGFNAFAAAAMRAAGIATETKMPAGTDDACPPLQPHQEAAVFLLHPTSPISRLLVDHPTGSGKTREMIEMLNGYFHDPRPKVPIFPKEAVCRNFYAELLRWPSLYRDYYSCLRPGSAACAAGSKDWRQRRMQLWDLSCFSEEEVRGLCRDMREVLEMKGCFYMGRMRRAWRQGFLERFPEESLPAAPLRALRYTSAGGRHTSIREDGVPVSALFKIGFEQGSSNVYNNKVVVMDEAHNLVRSQTLYGEQLAHLRELLAGAHGTVLAGFTGTPILNEASEGRWLLDIIKGNSAPEGDEGFLSSFPMRPLGLFPRSLPRGTPDAILTPKLRKQLVCKVPLVDEALQRYDEKRASGRRGARLQRYCNLSVHFGSFHDGKFGNRARILQEFQACAPKLHAIAQDVAVDPSKALILVHRSSGMVPLLEHLRSRGAAQGFGVATMEELSDFNAASNLRGERYRVLVADASQCSEGVSFFAVRRVLLCDVPASPSAFIQSVGRALRMYGHKGLEAEEQTVSTTLYVAGLPNWLRSPLGAWAYRCQRKQQVAELAASKARRLLRSLKRANVKTLDTLKQRLDSFGAQRYGEVKEAEAKAPMATTDVIAFLESIGLWQHASTIRDSFQKTARNRTSKAARFSDSKPGDAETKVASHGPKHYLERALQALWMAKSAEMAAEQLCLSKLTADEEALHMLAERSRELVPALSDFRNRAADREILDAVVRQAAASMPAPGEAKVESEGEDTAYEFGIASASSGDDATPPREVPLVLPSTWRIERVRRGRYETREFVDHQGRRFRTEAQAAAAVAAERRTANMANHARMKFANRLSSAESLVESMTDLETAGDASVSQDSAMTNVL